MMKIIAVALLMIWATTTNHHVNANNMDQEPKELIVQNNTPIPGLTRIVTFFANSLGIEGVKIVINQMRVTRQGTVRFKARVEKSPIKDMYVIYVNVKYGEKGLTSVIAHEMVHMRDMVSGSLSINDADRKIVWNGDEYNLDDFSGQYDKAPWEDGAQRDSRPVIKEFLRQEKDDKRKREEAEAESLHNDISRNLNYGGSIDLRIPEDEGNNS